MICLHVTEKQEKQTILWFLLIPQNIFLIIIFILTNILPPHSSLSLCFALHIPCSPSLIHLIPAPVQIHICFITSLLEEDNTQTPVTEREVNLSFVKSRYYNYYYYSMSIFVPCVSRKTIIWKKQKLEVKFRIVFFHRHWKVNVTVYPKMNASKYGWSTKSSKERTRLFSQTTVEHLFYLSHVMRPHFQGKKKPNQVFKLLNKISLNISTRLGVIKTPLALQGKLDSFGFKKNPKTQTNLEGAESYTEIMFSSDEPQST